MELEFLRLEVARKKQEMYGSNRVSIAGRASTAEEEEQSSSEGEGSSDYVDDLPVKAAAPRGPRMSVSAEVFGKFNKQEHYVPPVHKKTPEQEQSLR